MLPLDPFALWSNIWMIRDFVDAYAALGPMEGKVAVAVAQAYQAFPHTFIVGLLSLMLSIQLVSLALKSKSC